MLNPIYSFSNEILQFSKDTILRSLNDQQRRTFLIASAIFGYLVAGYLAIQCYIRFQRSVGEVDKQADPVKKIDKQADLIKTDKKVAPVEKDKQADHAKITDEKAAPVEKDKQTDLAERDKRLDPVETNKKDDQVEIDEPVDLVRDPIKIDEPVVQNEGDPIEIDEQIDEQLDVEAISASSLEQAMELMFSDRGLDLLVEVGPFTPEQKIKRYEELKEAIEKILPKDINMAVDYREGMFIRRQTLLLQAIMCIEDPSRRREIVKILLDKGADPHIQGQYHDYIDPIEEAKATKDQQLIELLTNAKK